MLIKLFVHFCLLLETSEGYFRLKAWVRDLLENPRSPRKRYFDVGMIVLVLSSVALLVYSVENAIEPWMLWFDHFAVAVFILEYLLRLWLVGDLHKAVLDAFRQTEFLGLKFRLRSVLKEVLQMKWEYISSPPAIIDLLAILPSYRPIRLLRVFILFRLFKLFRYTRSIHGMTEVLFERRFEFYILAYFMVFVVLAAASAIYVFEGGSNHHGSIHTFFDAIYWAFVTLSTVGYGDIVPHSTEGRVVALALIISGIGVIAFTTSIVVAAFHEKLADLREHRVLSELERGATFSVICGYGEVGQLIAAKLKRARQRFVIIDHDEEKVRLATKRGCLAIKGDAANNDLLEAIGVKDRVHTLICVTNDDIKNVFITVSTRRMNAGLRILARAGSKAMARKLTLAGATHVVSPSDVVGQIAAEYVGRPTAFEAIYGILRGERDVALEAVRVDADSALGGMTLQELALPRRKLLLFGVIAIRDWTIHDVDHLYPLEGEYCFVFKPASDFRLQEGDILVLFGYEPSLIHFRRELGAGLFHLGGR